MTTRLKSSRLWLEVSAAIKYNVGAYEVYRTFVNN